MIDALNVGHTGLSVAKTSVDNLSNNIANENTPGYKKRVVDVKELGQLDSTRTGSGVKSADIYRITNEFLSKSLVTQNSKTEYLNKSAELLGSVENILKEGDNTGLSRTINSYLESLENLRSNPDSEVYISKLKSDGENLVSSLQAIYKSIEAVQKSATETLKDDVSKVQGILNKIGKINDEMAKKTVVSNELLDKRDQLEFELSKYVDVEVSDKNSVYELKISGEIAVHGGNIREVKVASEDIKQEDRFTVIDEVANKAYDSLKFQKDAAGIISPKTYNNGDVVTYNLNNNIEVSVTIGETIKDGLGHDVDLDGDGAADTVTKDNLTRALAYQINHNPNTKNLVTAYNGLHTTNADGKEVVDNSKDFFLQIESNVDGSEGSFKGRISISHNSGATRESLYKNDYQSTESSHREYVTFYGKEVPIKGGSIKAQLENLDTNSPNNKVDTYLKTLDSFAKTLSDISDEYIRVDKDNYVYGEEAIDNYDGGDIRKLNLFSGNSVETLAFNKNAVNDLDKKDLDYLATLQWKKDFSYNEFGQDKSSNNTTSLKEFYKNFRVEVSADKEEVDSLNKTQKTVQTSLQTSFNKLTKVDKDEEMLNLIKFQAAYTANAKIITTVEKMLETLLGLKS